MKKEQTTSSKKITVGLILSWIFWILFGLIGIITIFSDPIPGIIMLIMAAVLVPSINKLVDEKWKFHLSTGLKIAVIFVGFIIFGLTINKPETEKQQNNQLPVQQEETNQVTSAEEDTKAINNEKTIKTEAITTDTNQSPIIKTEDTPTVTIPAEYKSALNKATAYANTMNMSKQGVYDQLVSEYWEKFSPAAAQYAIDNVKANWNANALIKAKTYQNTMNMSPSAIHDQLTSNYGEKFTQAEADYAIQHLND